MPWYFLTFDFGAGHQSHSETYEWSSEVLKGDDREEFWEKYAPSHSDHVIGKVRTVKKLPKKVWEENMRIYKHGIGYYRRKIKELKETGILKNCRTDKYGRKKIGK
jgi:hypothetical protein